MIRLLENPESIFPLPGKINLYNHDCLHILLALGISLFDEAFVVGFTMGSDLKTNRFHVAVFKFLSNLLGRVDGRYDPPHLSVKSGRETFRFIQLPKILVFPTVAHVHILVTTSVNCLEIPPVPVVVIPIKVM